MAASESLSLEELTELLNKRLKAKRLKPVEPRTMYRYVEKGLLPGARRGPGASYDESTIDKLVFAKQLQAKTRLSLDEIREIVDQLSPSVIEAVARGREPLEVMDLRKSVLESLVGSFAPNRVGALTRVPLAARDPEEMHTVREFGAGRYARLGSFGQSPERPTTPAAALAEIADPRRAVAADREGQWTWLEVTKNFAIGARGLTEDDTPRLKAIGDWLRELMG
jgi:DNA-binding transcriptional MerR regulator